MFRSHEDNKSEESYGQSGDPHSTDPIDSRHLSAVPKYCVTEDFNTRLLNRIAEERYAEVRTKAFLPRHAPQFTWAQAVPVFATLALVAFVAVSVMNDFSSDTQPAEYAKSTVSQTTAQPTSSSDLPLGASLGLTDEYMTVQPVDNPTYASGQAPAARSAVNGVPMTAENASFTSMGAPSRFNSNVNWHFQREMELARRISALSNSLGSGHTYFEVIRYHYHAPNGESGIMIRLNPIGMPAQMQAPTQTQLIIRPQMTAPAQNNPLRNVSGSF